MDVRDLRGDHLRRVGSGEEQELVELVRGDVAQDAAVALLLEEPRRPRLGGHPVGTEADRLDDPADGARLDQLAGLDRRPVLEPLAVEDRIDALRLRLHAAHLCELLEGRHPRLVHHEVLAVAHDLEAERGPLVGDGSAHDELDLWIVQDLALAPGPLRPRVPLGERGRQVRLLGEEGDQLPAAANHRVDLAVDVAVVQADRREPDARGLRGRRALLRGDAARACRRPRDAGGGDRRPQERAAARPILLHRSPSPSRVLLGPRPASSARPPTSGTSAAPNRWTGSATPSRPGWR